MEKIVGNKINWLNKVNSTNDEMLRLISSGNDYDEGEVLATMEQFAGKGLGANKWISTPGKNLTFSILLKPDFLKADQQFFLNIVIALGVYDFVNAILKNKLVKIKWPNDIYITDKKIGGILISHSISGNSIVHTVVGIGVNINQIKFKTGIKNPVSLKHLTKVDHDLNYCLDILLEKINIRYFQLRNGNQILLRNDYIDALFGYFKWMKFLYDGTTIMARITGVSDMGLLQLETHDQRKFECDLKEIEFLI